MSEYPKPPFDTVITFIEDTFDPEEGSYTTEVDLNEKSTEELQEIMTQLPLAMKIVLFRLEQENQKG